MNVSMPRVVFRFKSALDSSIPPVSREMVDSLMRLSDTEEVDSMMSAAEAAGRSVAIELFRGKDGRPLLINFTTEEEV